MTKYLKIDFNIYQNISDFESKLPYPTGNFRIEKTALIDLLCKYGGFRNISISNKSYRLYEALVNFIFTSNNNSDGTIRLSRNADYKYSETSFKGNLSFIHGMLAACIFSEHYLGVNKFFHLTDKRLKVTGERSPDYFGINNNGDAFLIEGKGSVESVDKSTIEDGASQLSSISKVVRLRNQAPNETYTTFKRYVSTSNFNDLGKHYIDLIDPVEKDKQLISFDFDHAVYLHYSYVFNYLRENFGKQEEVHLEQISYICVPLGERMIGLHKILYKKLSQYPNDGTELFEGINSILKKSYNSSPIYYSFEKNRIDNNTDSFQKDIQEDAYFTNLKDDRDENDYKDSEPIPQENKLSFESHSLYINGYTINKDGICFA